MQNGRMGGRARRRRIAIIAVATAVTVGTALSPGGIAGANAPRPAVERRATLSASAACTPSLIVEANCDSDQFHLLFRGRAEGLPGGGFDVAKTLEDLAVGYGIKKLLPQLGLGYLLPFY